MPCSSIQNFLDKLFSNYLSGIFRATTVFVVAYLIPNVTRDKHYQSMMSRIALIF